MYKRISVSMTSLLIFLLMKPNTILRSYNTKNLMIMPLSKENTIIVYPFIWFLQPLWRFIEDSHDDRLLIYRPEDIRNVSRLAASKVCGYISTDAIEMLPESVRAARALDEGEEEDGKSFICICLTCQNWLLNPENSFYGSLSQHIWFKLDFSCSSETDLDSVM